MYQTNTAKPYHIEATLSYDKMANQLPFYTLTKTDFLNELQTTNKYVQSRLTDQNFNKHVKKHIAQRNVRRWTISLGQSVLANYAAMYT